MRQARGNLKGFPEQYSNGRSSDFKNFLIFSLHHQLFEINQNTEKTLSILMGLKGGDCVRKAELKIKQCENPLRALYANRKPVKFQRASRVNLIIKSNSSMGSSFSLNVSFFI